MSVNVSKNRIEFYPLGKDKDDIYKKLDADEIVTDLTLGETITVGDMFKNHFYKTLIVDTTQLEAKTYITLDTEIVKAEGTKVKCIALVMEIFTSTSLIELTSTEQKKYYTIGFYGNRIDCLIDAIKRSISDMDIGIGSVELAPINPVKIIYPSNNHYGKRVILHVYDF